VNTKKIKEEYGSVGNYLAQKKIEEDRKAAEAKLPKAELCAYCGDAKRAYRDIGGSEDIARICTDCEKTIADGILGAPQFEDVSSREPDGSPVSNDMPDGLEADGLEEEETPPRRRATKKKKNRAKSQKVSR